MRVEGLGFRGLCPRVRAWGVASHGVGLRAQGLGLGVLEFRV